MRHYFALFTEGNRRGEKRSRSHQEVLRRSSRHWKFRDVQKPFQLNAAKASKWVKRNQTPPPTPPPPPPRQQNATMGFKPWTGLPTLVEVSWASECRSQVTFLSACFGACSFWQSGLGSTRPDPLISSGLRVPYGELRWEEVAEDSRDSALKSMPLSPWLPLKPCCAKHEKR